MLAYAYGSLWVPATFHDEILRIDPVAMRIIARIHTGRFPAYLTAGGGSIWVAQDEATSVARIDPDTNALVATIPIGSQGSGKVQPFDVTWDPHTDQVLVTLNPGQGRIALIDGASQQVHMLDVAPAFACGRALPTPDGFWLDDTICSFDLFRYSSSAGGVVAHIQADPPDTNNYGAAVERQRPLHRRGRLRRHQLPWRGRETRRAHWGRDQACSHAELPRVSARPRRR